MKIKSQIKLAFDPEKSENSVIREIFENEFARTLWLGIRYAHRVKRGFSQKCLFISDYLKQGFKIDKPEHLETIMNNFFVEFIIEPKYTLAEGVQKYSKDFVEELFPYVVGKKKLEYVVSKKQKKLV